MLERLGATAPIVDAPSELEQCDSIILPAWVPDAMRKLDGMSDGIREQVRTSQPILASALACNCWPATAPKAVNISAWD